MRFDYCERWGNGGNYRLITFMVLLKSIIYVTSYSIYQPVLVLKALALLAVQLLLTPPGV